MEEVAVAVAMMTSANTRPLLVVVAAVRHMPLAARLP